MSSTSISSAANIAPEGWLDRLSDGKATKVIAVIPVVSTIIVFMKNHRLQKDLKSSSLSEEEKTEKLKRACLFTNTVNNWNNVQAIISIAASILLIPLALLSPPLAIVAPAAAFTLGLTVVIGASLIYVDRVNDKVRDQTKEKFFAPYKAENEKLTVQAKKYITRQSFVQKMLRAVCFEKSERASMNLTTKLENILKGNVHYLECDKFLESAGSDVAPATEAPRRDHSFADTTDGCELSLERQLVAKLLSKSSGNIQKMCELLEAESKKLGEQYLECSRAIAPLDPKLFKEFLKSKSGSPKT